MATGPCSPSRQGHLPEIGDGGKGQGRLAAPLPGRLVWNEEKTVRVLPEVAGRVQGVAVDVWALRSRPDSRWLR